MAEVTWRNTRANNHVQSLKSYKKKKKTQYFLSHRKHWISEAFNSKGNESIMEIAEQ